jgi:hypothetical protein
VLVLVLVLAAGTGAAALFYLLNAAPGGPLARSSNPPVIVPTVAIALAATSTGTPSATPLPTVTSLPTIVPALEVVFTDDFAMTCNLWQGDDSNYSARCENGEYTLISKAAHGNRWINYTQPYSDVIVEADMHALAGTGFIAQGLVFDLSSDAGSGYAFLIGQRAEYILYRFDKTGPVVLIYWTPSLTIKTGLAANRLKVVSQSSQIAIYVNDQWLNTVNDSTYDGGRVGFMLTNDVGGAKVAFDNVGITRINRPLDLPLPLPATVTATPSKTSVPPTATPVPLPTATATQSPAAKLRTQLDEAWMAGDWQQAITLIEALRVVDPTDLQLPDKLYAARINYGLQLLDAGNLQGALSQCQAALVLNPSGGEALQCIARAQPRPTATSTRVYIPPTSTPTNVYVPPAATPAPEYYTLYLTVRGYEQWGRPNPRCQDGFNDKSPVRKFTVDFTLVNRSPLSIDNWYPVFYSNGGRQIYTCYYEYDDFSGVPSVPAGGTRTVTFAAYGELSEYVSRMSLTLGSQQFQRCFAPYDGHEVPCQ